MNARKRTVLLLLAMIVGPLAPLLLFPTAVATVFLLPSAERATGYAISVDGLALSWSDGVSARRIALADGAGEWLSVRSLRVVPRWWSLAGDHLRFDTIQAEEVLLRRLPPGDPQAADDPLALPDIPRISVDRLAVERVDIAKEVAGERLLFTAKGGRRLGGEATAHLSVLSLAEPSFALTGTVSQNDREERFALRYEEAGGGPVGTRLAPLNGKAVGLTLDGVGWGSERKGGFALTVGGKGGAEGSYTFRSDDRRTLDLEARINPGLIDPRGDRAGTALVAVRLEVPKDLSSLTVAELHLGTPQGEARGHGRIDFARKAVEASVRLVADDLSKIDERLGGSMQGSLDISGDLFAPTGAASLLWANAVTPGARFSLVTLRAEGAPDDEGAAIALNLVAEAPRIAGVVDDDAPLVAQGRLRMTAEGAGWLERLEAASRGATATLAGRRSVDGKVDATIAVNVAQLERWVAGGAGGLALSWAPTGVMAPVHLTGPFRVEGKNVAGIAPYLGPESRVTGDLTLDDRGIALARLDVGGAGVRLTGKADYRFESQSADAALRFFLNRNEMIPVDADGAIRFMVKRQGEGIAGSVALTSDGVAFMGRRFEKVSLLLAGAGDETMKGTGTLSLARGDSPMTFPFAWNVDPSRGLSAKGEGRFTTSRFMIAASAGGIDGTLSAHDLADIGAFAALPLGGGLDAEGSWREGRLAVKASGRDLWYDDMAINRLEGRGDLAFTRGRPVGSFDAAVDYLATTDMVLTRAKLSGRVDAEGAGRLDASLQGYRGVSLSLDAGAAVTLAEGGGAVTVDRLQAELGDTPLTLERALTFRWNDRQRSVSGGLRVGSGTLTLRGEEKGQELSFTIDGKRLPLGLLSRFDLLAVHGEADLNLALSGPADAPVGVMGIYATVHPANRTGPQPIVLALAGKGVYRNKRLTASFDLTGGNSALHFEGEEPIVFSLAPAALRLDEAGHGRSSTVFDIDLLDFIGMAPRMSFGVSGRVAGRVDLSGRLDDPKAAGTITVRKGRFDLYDLGATVRDIDALLEAKEGNLTLTRFTAHDGATGAYGMEGRLLLSAVRRFPYRFTLVSKKAALIQRDDVSAHASGSLTLAGDADRLNIGGNMTLAPVSYLWSPSTTADPPELAVREVNLEYAPKRRAGALRHDPFEVTFDLDLALPGPARLEGPGIDSQWEGVLKLTGNSDAPLVEGALRLIRGRFDLFGRPLALTGGEAAFQNQSPPNPTLDFHALSRTTDLQIDVFLTGTAHKPDLTVTSSPTLPESEIMSALLFGRTMSGVTPLQAVQVAQALKVLSGGGPGGGNLDDLLKKSRKLLNLADLRLTQNADNPGEYGIGVGAYIGSGAYVEAERSLAGRGTKVTVEVEVTDSVTLDTQVGEDAQSGVGVNWKRDY